MNSMIEASDDSDLTRLFISESEKLRGLIEHMKVNSELSLSEIIEIYYQTTNVSSLAIMFKNRIDDEDENKSLLKKVKEIEFIISTKFDSGLHPSILENLSISIQEKIKNLQDMNSTQKSNSEIEDDAKLYEELRQMMSTKEFVEQYDKQLHD